MAAESKPYISAEILYSAGRDNPAGVDLGDSHELLSLQQLYDRALIEHEDGSAPSVDWSGIETVADDLLHRSVDMRLLVPLAAAVLHTQGLDAFADVLRTIEQLVSEHWLQWYPRAFEDGEDIDAEWRGNVISELRDKRIIDGLRGLRPFPQTRSIAACTIADLLPARDGKSPDTESLRRTIADQPVAAADVACVSKVLGDCANALARTVAHMADQWSVYIDVSRLISVCESASRCLLDLESGVMPRADMGIDASAAMVSQGNATPSREAARAETLSRESAKAELQRLIDFFAQTEPSSPIPLYLRRAQELVGLDFRQMIKRMGADMQSFMNEE